jgi:hypothetical protein
MDDSVMPGLILIQTFCTKGEAKQEPEKKPKSSLPSIKDFEILKPISRGAFG